jgi:hypothetical protein
MLSEALERLYLPKFPLWAAEVKLDEGDRFADAEPKGRVDYMAFMPKNQSHSIRSIETGCVHAFEVKSCMADFRSGHGLNRVGDVNWLVVTGKLWEQLIDTRADTSGWNGLVWRGDEFWGANPLRPEQTTGRKMPVSQAMWMMLMSSKVHVRNRRADA